MNSESGPAAPSVRVLNALAFIACAGMMAYALFAQHVLNLEPCPLCVFQRVGVMAMGAVFFVAALHNPGRAGLAVYASILFVAGATTVGIAGRHVWLQGLPPDKVPACGPGLDFMLDAFPLREVLDMVLTGSGECADISWSFLGLSMPMWVLLSAAGLLAFGLWANLLRGPDPQT